MSKALTLPELSKTYNDLCRWRELIDQCINDVLLAIADQEMKR